MIEAKEVKRKCKPCKKITTQIKFVNIVTKKTDYNCLECPCPECGKDCSCVPF